VGVSAASFDAGAGADVSDCKKENPLVACGAGGDGSAAVMNENPELTAAGAAGADPALRKEKALVAASGAGFDDGFAFGASPPLISSPPNIVVLSLSGTIPTCGLSKKIQREDASIQAPCDLREKYRLGVWSSDGCCGAEDGYVLQNYK
jgi:hypothetical protein